MISTREKSLRAIALVTATLLSQLCGLQRSWAEDPAPLLAVGQAAVDWWFMFKFNAQAFPGCDGGRNRTCIFDKARQPQNYQYGQQFVYASSNSSILQKGSGCAGSTVQDPLGATVSQVYTGNFHYVVWNDQFYNDPAIAGCSSNCSSPWGHSKGMLAWSDSGAGFVLQVSTPSWLGAGSKAHPRTTDGNTLGCVTDDNVKVSQHFFALKLTSDDVLHVLEALANASVVTDISNPQIFSNGGPADIQAAARNLGRKSNSQTIIDVTLSSKVRLIGKPSGLNVPPWQMVSSRLGGISLRTATWWAPPQIPSTTANTVMKCWSKDPMLKQPPGAVEIATSGTWNGTPFVLKGGPSADDNHAKIGVSLNDPDGVAVFGDLNQQGKLSGNCGSSQNGRGGLFFVMTDAVLATGIRTLIAGQTAPSVGH